MQARLLPAKRKVDTVHDLAESRKCKKRKGTAAIQSADLVTNNYYYAVFG